MAERTDDDADPHGFDPAGEPVRWRSFFEEARHRLAAAGIDSAEIDARRIVETASGSEGAAFFAGLEEFATNRGVALFDRMLDRRVAGEPLQYVLGSWSFRTLDLMVDQRVLIPRPETEVVAGVAISELDRVSDGSRELVAVDLGTGSGAIGLSIAAERVDTRVVLTDSAPEALVVARANLTGVGRSAVRVTIAEGSWFDALNPELRGLIDVVVSNPPYVGPDDELPEVVRDWEPPGALIAADHGRAHLAVLLDDAGAWLRPGGALVLEMAPAQTGWAAARAAALGFDDVAVIADFAGRERVLRARWPR